MNSSNKGLTDNKAAKLGALNKVTTLNPNAAEFVPTCLKYTYGITKSCDATECDLSGSSKRAVLDQSISNTSNNSDDEVPQYWHQLPDDITPNFEAIEEELHEPGHLTLAGLSIHDALEQSKFSTSMTNQLFDKRQDLSSLASDNANLHGKMGYPGSICVNEQSSVPSLTSASNIWGKQHTNGERQWKGHHYHLDYNSGLVGDLGENVCPENVTDPIEFLSSQFPGFTAQSLAGIYYGNGCDLNLTVEILTQLELQVDVDFGQNVNSNSLGIPKLSTLDIPAVPVPQNGLPKYTGDDVQHGSSIYRAPSGISRSGIDFSSTVRKLPSQNSGHWRNERNSFDNAAAGSSGSSQLLFSSYDGSNKMLHGDKWHTTDAARSPVWLGTEEAVETREEAHDFARLQNTCFEQARLAYLIGNKAFVKELSSKGQLYNLQMKAAHEKAKDAIYRKRNPPSPEIQGYSQGQNRLIDLHGLHVTEAIHVLNHELRILRSTARATGQRLHVMIFVGTGLHTKASRTPVRLPVAIEQYLLDEGLHYTQPQPGLLRVVIY